VTASIFGLPLVEAKLDSQLAKKRETVFVVLDQGIAWLSRGLF
jgi:hypothetical protein